MAILNYRTTVPVDRTVAEIQRRLVAGGARSVRLDYSGGGLAELEAVMFALDTPAGLRGFRLPANVEGVRLALQRARDRDPRRMPANLVTRAHATRVAWRIVKDWIEAQVAIIESGQVSAAQAYFPYMLVGDGSATLYELLAARQFALPPGRGEEAG